MSETQTKFDHWCIVEVFGHERIAGRVTEQTIGGCSFIRVDVPPTKNHNGFTRLFGQGAIYSITPVEESIARLAAEEIQARPVTVYLPRLEFGKPQEVKALFAPEDDDDHWSDDE